MMCRKCKKSTKAPTAKSWNKKLCNKCATKSKLQLEKITIPADTIRLHTTPVDLYLDYWTEYELGLLNK